MSINKNSGKLPGKTKYAGRRRAMTRKSGFSVHEETSGGEFVRHHARTYELSSGESLEVKFCLSEHEQGDLLGFGMWFWHTPGIQLSSVGAPPSGVSTVYGNDSWNKVGSIWKAESSDPIEISIYLKATTRGEVALYGPMCGVVRHEYLDSARVELLGNMYQFAPEAIFLDKESGTKCCIKVSARAGAGVHLLILKSCNRCGRYLPVNVPAERDHLSFSNHCVAEHRRPCKHTTFGRLRNKDDASDVLNLEYGFQLECRFCKKFEVNAAHNPQRSYAQMKEDGARRRAFEFLLEDIYGGTPQLRYRHETGGELAEDIWERFGRSCFKCGVKLSTPRAMHLDHTRPLALLWPLDKTGTSLCKSCNSEKRDRVPSEFYPPEKLKELSRITGIPLQELSSVGPNEDALDRLVSNLDQFFEKFLTRQEMIKERDGKIVGELVVKALQKVLSRSPKHKHIDLRDEFNRRGARRR